MFSNTTDLICSTIRQSTYAGNPAVSVGGTANLGALMLIGNVRNSDAAGMALYNQGAGAGASVSLDMYNTPTMAASRKPKSRQSTTATTPIT